MAVYISIIALIFSGVAIYCSWIVHKQNQKVLAAQKKTELLQKIDTEIFKNQIS
ncbi:MAG: hypothetical protein SCARUB_00373 [Candidatus Scalindua rubra]|uniref:Uncharacterized protein n=1 Tax=Candidatus Scalindua rubra TaxID=1872076 RepID=A0A1E3XFT1_9BACT|nr:MAG: hypothetical protein SCARUB_00373 [Candidatus Scalindua rubra]